MKNKDQKNYETAPFKELKQKIVNVKIDYKVLFFNLGRIRTMRLQFNLTDFQFLMNLLKISQSWLFVVLNL